MSDVYIGCNQVCVKECPEIYWAWPAALVLGDSERKKMFCKTGVDPVTSPKVIFELPHVLFLSWDFVCWDLAAHQLLLFSSPFTGKHYLFIELYSYFYVWTLTLFFHRHILFFDVWTLTLFFHRLILLFWCVRLLPVWPVCPSTCLSLTRGKKWGLQHVGGWGVREWGGEEALTSYTGTKLQERVCFRSLGIPPLGEVFRCGCRFNA